MDFVRASTYLGVNYEKKELYSTERYDSWCRIRKGETLHLVNRLAFKHILDQTRGGDLYVQVYASIDNYHRVGEGYFYVKVKYLSYHQ